MSSPRERSYLHRPHVGIDPDAGSQQAESIWYPLAFIGAAFGITWFATSREVERINRQRRMRDQR